MVTFETLRERSKQTRDEIAAKLDKTVNSVSKYECSERIPSSKVILELKSIYNCSSDEILSALEFHLERFNYKHNRKKNNKLSKKN